MTVIVALLLPMIASSCRTTSDEVRTEPSGYPIPITATTGMIADTVSQVGDKNVKVTTPIGAGIIPHLYKPTRSLGGQAPAKGLNGKLSE